jgi:hypothetical protein
LIYDGILKHFFSQLVLCFERSLDHIEDLGILVVIDAPGGLFLGWLDLRLGGDDDVEEGLSNFIWLIFARLHLNWHNIWKRYSSGEADFPDWRVRSFGSFMVLRAYGC